MSAIKFSCPGCGQHIECDEGYAGRQVNCPSCQTAMVVPGGAPPPEPAGPSCPGCGAVLSAGAVICTSCGMNLKTGKKIQPQTISAPAGYATKTSSGFKGGRTLLTGGIIGLVVLLIFAFGGEAVFKAVAIGIQIVGLIVEITVIVAAFQDGAGQGFLTLCIPFYALFFTYFRSDSPPLKRFVSIYLITLLGGFLGVLMRAMMAASS